MALKKSASIALSRRWALRLIWLIISLMIIGGCAYGTLPPRIVAGRSFSIDSAQAIQRGISASEVRRILGEPLEIIKTDDKESWRYFAREQKEGVTYVFGLIPKTTVQFLYDYELTVKIEAHKVVTANFRETRIK